MNMQVSKVGKIKGRYLPPPDKSITHRAVMVGALAVRGFKVRNPLISDDILSTVRCLRLLGKSIEVDGKEIKIEAGGFKEPEEILDCGNSGTTARLLAGILAGQPFLSILYGDSSLRRRPMGRVVEPLVAMGAHVSGREGGNLLPLTVKGGELHGIDFQMPVASAQVKSAVILAGMKAQGMTMVRESISSRDHLERMLSWLGTGIIREKGVIKIPGNMIIEGGEISVCGDFSSAAFFIAAALLIPGSELIIENVNLNPTRTGMLDVVKRMGGKVEILDVKNNCGEEVGTLRVRYSILKSTEIRGNEIPLLIDEVPLIILLATQAEGTTLISGARELRYKETDRLKAMALNLREMGARIEEKEDGMIITGPVQLRPARLKSFGDHRIAMTMAVASGLVASGYSEIEDFQCVSISYPDFLSDFRRLAGD